MLTSAGSMVSATGQQAANRVDAGSLQSATKDLVDRVQGALSGLGGIPTAMTFDQRNAEIGTLVARRVTDGQLSQPDRDRMNLLVSAEYRNSLQEARALVQLAEQHATQAARELEETARKAVHAAASGASIAAFAIFAIMLLGAFAAVFGARRGTRDLPMVRTARAG